ncbi:LuxR family transcriptional regulator [Sandaracinomonas limnophila]|uniref:LuxR family transcriptional regulator n=1 Tax=Sandaracinomonas limnophila TaxID=1862386 RepID=A0A437PMV9_9BACT|nr:helix-turn-helix transcriptional regulator [Sandaracinomonas limnophila]RVU23414.1 LuxR family transcriptional regulator [Sandaracinomonas limnophila]
MKKSSQFSDFDFTSREIEILRLAKNAYSCKEIADLLFISELTVRKHRQNILLKIGCTGKKEFRKFLREIILPPP